MQEFFQFLYFRTELFIEVLYDGQRHGRKGAPPA